MKACRLKRFEDKLECGQIETLLAMIGAGMGIGIVQEMTMILPTCASATRNRNESSRFFAEKQKQ
ncbi:MAG: hypothetical protein L7V87_03205 [Verrucomicrobiales bacterium]|nr:hypothetical protein [Verrucomicrobiales bacterium]